MKTWCKLTRALSAGLAITAFSTAAWAAGPAECGLIGTWAGHAYTDLLWLGVHTAGTQDFKGEMLLDWVSISDRLLMAPAEVSQDPQYAATRMTSGRGVWEQYAKGQYRYTWYAYGVGADGNPVYVVRVTGLAANTDCDNIKITYTYEAFKYTFPPQNVASGDLLYVTDSSVSSDNSETRVTLVTPVTP